MELEAKYYIHLIRRIGRDSNLNAIAIKHLLKIKIMDYR